MPKRSIDMGKFQKIKKKMKKLERLLESVSTSSSSDTYHEDFSDRPEPRRRMRISSDEDIEPDEPIVTVAQVHNPPTETGAITAEGGGQTDVNNMLVNLLGVDPTTLSAPKVNPEMDAILSSLDKKKDSVLAGLQNKLGTGLAAKKPDLKLLQIWLMQEEFFVRSIKHQFYPTLDKTVQKVAEESKHDNFLFGSDFHEQCRSAQTIQKTFRELKVHTGTKRTSVRIQEKPERNNLNFKRPLNRSKMRQSTKENYRFQDRRQQQQVKLTRTYRQQRNLY
ncbi:hypothetical protein JTB14_029650 [Gonioctena quinquepunctata]|nr:hypothetical protein JTB14_029650 [Gonioctena quinquepunctata]